MKPVHPIIQDSTNMVSETAPEALAKLQQEAIAVGS